MVSEQLVLPWHKTETKQQSKAWEIDLATEAKAMIDYERAHIKQIRLDFMDQIMGLYSSPGDKLALIPVQFQEPMTELWVNNKCVGAFVQRKEGLVFRVG